VQSNVFLFFPLSFYSSAFNNECFLLCFFCEWHFSMIIDRKKKHKMIIEDLAHRKRFY